MATATALAATNPRGMKRKCQNEACALPFYDLNRSSFACPNCSAPFDLELQARVEAAALAGRGYQRRNNKQFPMPIVAAVAEPEAVEADVEAVVDEIAEDGASVAGEDVILEQEDENEGAVDLGPLPEDGNEE